MVFILVYFVKSIKIVKWLKHNLLIIISSIQLQAVIFLKNIAKI